MKENGKIITDGKMNEIGIIIVAHKIPDGSIVTKRTGTYRHLLKKKMAIYGKNSQVLQQQGIVYIIKINDPEYITAIPNDTELIWWTTEEEFYNYIDYKREEARAQ